VIGDGSLVAAHHIPERRGRHCGRGRGWRREARQEPRSVFPQRNDPLRAEVEAGQVGRHGVDGDDDADDAAKAVGRRLASPRQDKNRLARQAPDERFGDEQAGIGVVPLTQEIFPVGDIPVIGFYIGHPMDDPALGADDPDGRGYRQPGFVFGDDGAGRGGIQCAAAVLSLDFVDDGLQSQVDLIDEIRQVFVDNPREIIGGKNCLFLLLCVIFKENEGSQCKNKNIKQQNDGQRSLHGGALPQYFI